MEKSAINGKKIAAGKAIGYVKNGMTLGLGTGSTAYWAIQGIGEMVKNGLSVRAIATSMQSDALAREAGIPMVPFAEIDHIDLTIDGADEVDEGLNLIKGGGGALLREKIVAAATKFYIIIVDGSKMVSKLGKFPLPVEVAPFGWEMTMKRLTALGCTAKMRMTDKKAEDGGASPTAGTVLTGGAPPTAGAALIGGMPLIGATPFLTDNSHYILDCSFGLIQDPALLHEQVSAITGVMEDGFFIDMADIVVVGSAEGDAKVIGRKDIK